MGNLLCCNREPINFDDEVELTHFSLLRSVGKGAFGKVRMVKHRKTHDTFALKYINKEKCIKMKAVDNIIQERKILEELDHPFICNLRYAFQDEENCFMVLDLMMGGDIRFHSDRMVEMPEELVKFYVAETALAISYLHQKNIVHRDIKPDNLLLDGHGHAHLTDFNIATHFREDRPLMSIAGSLAYMAPEILAKQGYGPSCDWWSLGIVAYELLYGKRPFRGKNNENLTQNVLEQELEFPDHVKISPVAKSFLKEVLNRNVFERLGVRQNGGIEKFKKHEWFTNIDWDKLLRKDIVPIFIPDSTKANFDATYELEELLVEDTPLRVKPRRKDKNGEIIKRDPNIIAKNDPIIAQGLITLDAQFTVFDYTKPRTRTMAMLPPDQSSSTNTESSSKTVVRSQKPVEELQQIDRQEIALQNANKVLKTVEEKKPAIDSGNDTHPKALQA